MIRLQPRSTLTYTLLPYTTLFLSRDEMNAVNFRSRSLADAKLTDARERAYCWIDSARPVIKAYQELDQIDGDLCLAGHAFQNDGDLIGRGATDEARRLVGQRVNELHEIIEGIRDEVIAENGWQWREGCTEDEEDAGIDLNDTLARETLSVVGAIKAVEASA